MSTDAATRATRRRRSWPLERVLFCMAGSVALAGVLLAAFVSPWFLIVPGFVALNQLLFAWVGDCPTSLALRRWLGFQGCSR